MSHHRIGYKKLTAYNSIIYDIHLLGTGSYTQKARNILHVVELLPDTQNNGLRMLRECRELFPHHRG